MHGRFYSKMILYQRKLKIIMIHFERSLEIDAKPVKIWEVLSNFMHIDEFAPEIKSVDELTKGKNGVGSKRRNHFNNGNSMIEEVTEWSEGESFKVKMSEMGPMPLKAAYSTVSIELIGKEKSKVTWDFDYEVKYGPLGWIMGQTMMKMIMGKVVNGNLQGLSDKSITK